MLEYHWSQRLHRVLSSRCNNLVDALNKKNESKQELVWCTPLNPANVGIKAIQAIKFVAFPLLSYLMWTLYNYLYLRLRICVINDEGLNSVLLIHLHGKLTIWFNAEHMTMHGIAGYNLDWMDCKVLCRPKFIHAKTACSSNWVVYSECGNGCGLVVGDGLQWISVSRPISEPQTRPSLKLDPVRAPSLCAVWFRTQTKLNFSGNLGGCIVRVEIQQLQRYNLQQGNLSAGRGLTTARELQAAVIQPALPLMVAHIPSSLTLTYSHWRGSLRLTAVMLVNCCQP